MRKTMRCMKEGNKLACEKDREKEETLNKANKWEERRFQRRVEVGRERMKLLLKEDLHIPVNVTYNESLPGN